MAKDEACLYPGCMEEPYKDKVRCLKHLMEATEYQKKRYAKLAVVGKCRCGADVKEGFKACFLCTFKIKEDDVEDWVDLLTKHNRSFNKLFKRDSAKG